MMKYFLGIIALLIVLVLSLGHVLDISRDNYTREAQQHVVSTLTEDTSSPDNTNEPTTLVQQAPLVPSNSEHPILSQLRLPQGMQIDVYGEVPNARSLEVVSENGNDYVFVGNRNGDSVYVLIDTDQDGRADERKTIFQGGKSPNGVAYQDGDLYVAEVSRILRFSGILNQLDEPKYEVIYDTLPSDASHGWKYIAFGPDGDLYIPIGAPCNICDAGLPYSALHKLDLETGEFSVVAEGIRNTVGFDRHPETQELRFTDNGRDWFGNNIPPDELNVIDSENTHYGYPFCHGGIYPDDQFNARACTEFTAPFANLGPHVAALGMLFSDPANVPAGRDNHILIAEHGSRNRTPATGYRISAVNLETAEYTPFIDGRLQGGKTLGRPVDIATLPDGSLLISDDYANLVYRVYLDDTKQDTSPADIPEKTPPQQAQDPQPRSIEAFRQENFAGTGLTLEETLANNQRYTRYRISYMSNGIKVSGIMNIPLGEGPFPLLILNHGYIDPAVYTVGRGLKREQDYLARNGFAVLHTDYRNHGLSDSDPQLEQNYVFRNYFYSADAINAILAVQERSDPRIDTANIGMLGHSMGGGVTMHAMIARPDLVDAGILYAPVHSNEYFNFYRWRYEGLTSGEKLVRADRLGDLSQIDTFAPYSAARYLDYISGAIQIYHGTNDESCPYQWSVDTVDAMQQAGIDAQLITYTGEYHEFGPEFYNFMEGARDFFRLQFTE